jgi:16S rRNA (guanine966-N2)-methyltransferase
MKPGVRVSGGELRGRGLAVPPGARPTEGRVREALFSIWDERIVGARVLDLFAGSGVVGIEAAGRGALEVWAVDDDARAARTIAENAGRLAPGAVTVRRMRLPAGLARLSGGPFDLVFADPPYAFTGYAALLAAVAPILAADGEVVVEHSARLELPVEAGPLVRTDVRRYGESSLSFYHLQTGTALTGSSR